MVTRSRRRGRRGFLLCRRTHLTAARVSLCDGPGGTCDLGDAEGAEITRIVRSQFTRQGFRIVACSLESRVELPKLSMDEFMRRGQGNGFSQPQLYEFRVRGHLGAMTLRAFDDLVAVTDGPDTRLSGMIADQAALYGVLARMEELGLDLIDVRRLESRS